MRGGIGKVFEDVGMTAEVDLIWDKREVVWANCLKM
jgi:hypothetical protein